MVKESWFSGLWRKRSAEGDKAVVGVLAFEVAGLMSKAVHLWCCLSDKQVSRLRDEVINMEGVRKLVSNDDDFILGLAWMEIADSLYFVARSVARLARRCSVPILQGFHEIFEDLIKNDGVGTDLYGLEFASKKMERKVKKMERLVAASANLYQEMEVLSELEQALRRMQASTDPVTRGNLIAFQHKVLWQRQQVKNLRDSSLWNRTYDYTVRILVRSLFTIFMRIKHVFGFRWAVGGQIADSRLLNHLPRSQSVHPSESNITRFASGPLVGRSIAKSGPISGPIKASGRQQLPNNLKTKRSGPGRPFGGCIISSGINSPVLRSHMPVNNGYPRINGVSSGILNGLQETTGDPCTNPPVLSSKHRLLNAPPSTLGAAALALHYANVIIVIEKLVASPHLISPDARDDLYNMLPTSVRAALRARLKSYAKNLASPIYDTVLATEWSDALGRIFEWLAPLAHNMIRWQSERNFEQQHLVSKTNVLLLQTLYFANQAKTEAAITELLVGLNYLWRFGRELNAKALLECAGSTVFGDFLDSKG